MIIAAPALARNPLTRNVNHRATTEAITIDAATMRKLIAGFGSAVGVPCVTQHFGDEFGRGVRQRHLHRRELSAPPRLGTPGG